MTQQDIEQKAREIAANLMDGWDFGSRFVIALDYGEECVNAGIESQRQQIAEKEQHHDASMIELAKLAKVDVSDEPRFKHVYTALASFIADKDAEIERLKQSEQYAWKNTHEIEKDRQGKAAEIERHKSRVKELENELVCAGIYIDQLKHQYS